MATITLKNLAHRYSSNSRGTGDWVIQEINHHFKDGGAYALLGPSGCGKTTLLNIISGLVTPTEGQVLFNDQDFTRVETTKRQIAQVFQFPVVYDTMTVFDNLAFPLRNHGVSEPKIKKRLAQIAELLNLENILKKKAKELTADIKQKISLGRGLVREDVNIIMFDEPLTVIDPQLKWELRTKLKQLHQKVGATLIYVTHDQTEALTFANQVVVMHEGKIVQTGSPTDLFEKSEHTFVGHFIGSPGMNFIPVESDGDKLIVLGCVLETSYKLDVNKKYEFGIRPEFIKFSDQGHKVKIESVQNLGRHKIITVDFKGHSLKMIVSSHVLIPSDPKISFITEQSHLYADSWRVKVPIQIRK